MRHTCIPKPLEKSETLTANLHDDDNTAGRTLTANADRSFSEEV
jgi:hypothetical protein